MAMTQKDKDEIKGMMAELIIANHPESIGTKISKWFSRNWQGIILGIFGTLVFLFMTGFGKV